MPELNLLEKPEEVSFDEEDEALDYELESNGNRRNFRNYCSWE